MKQQQVFRLEEAEKVAKRYELLLATSTERIAIAGSVRRKRPFVHDIDLVVIPKTRSELCADQMGLFGGGKKEYIHIDILNEKLGEFEDVEMIRGVRNGDRIKCVEDVESGIQIDINLATLTTWPMLLLVKTGSKEHNIMLAKEATKRRLLFRANGYGLKNQHGGYLPIKTEEDIFNHLGIEYVKPECREVV